MAKTSLWEHFKSSITSAVSDVREKVVEEGWFGRPTAPKQSMAASLGWEQPDSAQANGDATMNIGIDAPSNISVAPLTWEDLRADMRGSQGQPSLSDRQLDQEQGMDR